MLVKSSVILIRRRLLFIILFCCSCALILWLTVKNKRRFLLECAPHHTWSSKAQNGRIRSWSGSWVVVWCFVGSQLTHDQQQQLRAQSITECCCWNREWTVIFVLLLFTFFNISAEKRSLDPRTRPVSVIVIIFRYNQMTKLQRRSHRRIR